MADTESEDISDTCFNQFLVLIHDITGITIRADRRIMLMGRLRSRMRKLDLDSYESYLDYLKKNKDENKLLTNAITTNETYFYRTPRIWDYISDDFLPDWHDRNSGQTLRIWSAASSTGEEAHTLGIVLQQFKENNLAFNYQILGTDIAPRVVEHASRGVYTGRSIERFREVKPELFSKYMTGDDEKGFSVVPKIRKQISFDVFNLFDSSGKQPKHDLVLLRNVLIYFTKIDQALVMANLHKRLAPRGIAIIGESETLNNLNTAFESVNPTIYRAVDSAEQKKAA